MMVKIWIYPVAILLTTLPCLGMHTGIAGGAAADLPATISGGPDGFGYTWNDHPYQWIDIRGLNHTNEVAGLGDDNVVGFFDFTLDPPFRYFWYEVNQFCLGSNGYISFSDANLMAHPFQRPPSIRRPQDVLFALVDDLTFIYDGGDTGHVYYNWEDFGDTLIVQFQDVPFWANVPGGCDGLNTFEIILVAQPDTQGTIIYQYHTQEGSGSGTRYLGWEEMSGQIGWEIPNSEAAPGEAIIIENTDPQNPEITDMAVLEAIREDNKGFLAYRGGTVEIWATLKNMGNQYVSDASARCVIERMPGGTVVYDQIKEFGDFEPGQVKTISWDASYQCNDGTGTYAITVTQLLEDFYAPNDEVVVEMQVIVFPAEITYADGSMESCWAWGESWCGWATRFCVPDSVLGDSLWVSEVSAFICSGILPCDIWLVLMDDNGPGGSPGDTLADSLITISPGTPLFDWITFTVDPPVAFNEGDCFYGVYAQPHEYNPYFGKDEDPPYSLQGWQYRGSVWEVFRDNDNQELGIKIYALPGELPDIMITLIPHQTQIHQGGKLDYTCIFENTRWYTVSEEFWFYALRDTTVMRTFGPWSISLDPGEIVGKEYSLPVPVKAPLDEYAFCGYTGFYPDGIDGESCFDFEIVEGPVCVSLEVITPQVRRGHKLRYELTVTNCTEEQQDFSYWSKVRLPDGEWYKHYLVPPTPLILDPEEVITHEVAHMVPSKARLGEYEYWGYVGPDTTRIWNEDMFTFTVIEDSLSGRHHPGIDNDEWTVTLERSVAD
jgi:hypothetical protein